MESHKLEDCIGTIFRLINSVNCVQLAAVIFQVLFITIFFIFFSLNYSKNVAIVSRSFIFSTFGILFSPPCPIL